MTSTKTRNHERIHACAVRIRLTNPELSASDLFATACGLCGVRRNYTKPSIP